MSIPQTLVVGQSGGPTAVINCSLAGILAESMAHPGQIERVLGLRFGVEGLLAGDFVDLTRRPSEFLARLSETPSSLLGSCRYKLRAHDVDRALDALRGVGARYFLYIGGNDSADTTLRLSEAARARGYDLRCIGVPKTVDNDLAEMDHSPGYGSAARFLAIAAMEACRDTEAMRRTDPIKIIEVAGRHAGWLAAASALGRRTDDEGPHLVYVPEHPVYSGDVLDDVASAYRRWGHVVMVVSENQPEPGGAVLGSGGEPRYVDAFGHKYYASPADYLAGQIRERLGLRARFEKPGTLQRMSIPYRSSVDAEEASRVGRAAVKLALESQTGVMAVLRRASDEPYRCDITTASLARVANQQRTLPPEFVDGDRRGITDAFRRYALPLLGEPLPEHARLV